MWGGWWDVGDGGEGVGWGMGGGGGGERGGERVETIGRQPQKRQASYPASSCVLAVLAPKLPT